LFGEDKIPPWKRIQKTLGKKKIAGRCRGDRLESLKIGGCQVRGQQRSFPELFGGGVGLERSANGGGEGFLTTLRGKQTQRNAGEEKMACLACKKKPNRAGGRSGQNVITLKPRTTGGYGTPGQILWFFGLCGIGGHIRKGNRRGSGFRLFKTQTPGEADKNFRIHQKPGWEGCGP